MCSSSKSKPSRGNGLPLGPKGRRAWPGHPVVHFLAVLSFEASVPCGVWNLFLIKLISCPANCLSSLSPPMVLVPLGRSMKPLHYWHYYIEELLVKVIEIVFRLLESKNLLSLHLPSLEIFFQGSINLLRPSNPLPRVERTPLPPISC